MSTKRLGLVVVALGFGSWLVSGCATGTGPGFNGEGGEGGGPGAGGMGGMNGASSSSASSSNASSSNASSSNASSSNASSSSASSSSSGGGQCGATEHLCAGVCAGNTPQTGCFTSTTCTPCPVVQNGAATCNATGLCDVSCNSGYAKNGSTCVCSSPCCTDADCAAGQTCMGGVCSGGASSSSGGACDLFACAFGCAFEGKDCDPISCACI